eukprot:Opistho-1_new@99775
MSGTTLKDVNSHDFVRAYAAFLKRSGKIEVPKWADIVKTGTHKELAPYDADWFYIRCASIARKLYLSQGLGVGALRRAYGGRKNNGTRPSHFCVGSGAVARRCLHELEKIKVVEKANDGGRKVSQEGRRDLDRIAGQVAAALRK